MDPSACQVPVHNSCRRHGDPDHRDNPSSSHVPGCEVSMLCMALMVSLDQLSALLNGHASLSAEMALRIGKAFDVRMDMLLRMQAWHDTARMRARASEIAVHRYDPACSTVSPLRDFAFSLTDSGRQRYLWLILLELPLLVDQVQAGLKWLPVSSPIMVPVFASGTHGPPASGGGAGSCSMVCPERSSRSALLQGRAEDASRENGRCV